ncbi:MAG: hypothetical protein IPM61_02320 [Chlorobi bacterium]|nr:hypothetical protein [Chlorobiota bacterium]
MDADVAVVAWRKWQSHRKRTENNKPIVAKQKRRPASDEIGCTGRRFGDSNDVT